MRKPKYLHSNHTYKYNIIPSNIIPLRTYFFENFVYGSKQFVIMHHASRQSLLRNFFMYYTRLFVIACQYRKWMNLLLLLLDLMQKTYATTTYGWDKNPRVEWWSHFISFQFCTFSSQQDVGFLKRFFAFLHTSWIHLFYAYFRFRRWIIN